MTYYEEISISLEMDILLLEILSEDQMTIYYF